MTYAEYCYIVSVVLPKASGSISVTWRSGGQTGGSCWDEGDPSHIAIEADPEPELTELDDLLEAVVPNMGFIRYKKVLSKAVKHEQKEENEYYGDVSIYDKKTVDLKELYDILVEMKVF